MTPMHVLALGLPTSETQRLVPYLAAQQHTVSLAEGLEGLSAELLRQVDVVLVDLSPGEVVRACQRVRAVSSVPLVVVATRDAPEERVAVLELGADDYVRRPCSARELLARMASHVRRARRQAGPPAQTVVVGPLALSLRSLSAELRGQPLLLTVEEIGLLWALAQRAGSVLTRTELLDALQGPAADTFDRAIDVRVSRIRRKLGDDAALLRTVRGVGYALVPSAVRPVEGPHVLPIAHLHAVHPVPRLDRAPQRAAS